MIPLFDINVGLNFVEFICDPCREGADTNNIDLHAKCPGKTHCPCQHKRAKN